ncbi:MAG: zinc-dependent peptidase [Glaciimonas sp.]|nr:zinc-dependent peptidase [Glaciimonas sp.]
MALILLMALLMLGVGLLFWLPKYRLQRAIARPFPRRYAKILRKNVPVYARMPADLQLQLKHLIQQFLHQKKFVGCDGLTITDEIKLTIAGKACLLLLNRVTLVYPALSFVLVYPTAFVVRHAEVAAGGLVTHRNQVLLGESWSDDRVILAWDHVRRSNAENDPGHDVVLHEFAHQLDSESGSTNGAPYLMSKARYARWSSIFSEEFALLQEAAQHHSLSVIDHYGATNPAEFFAVATEAFFEKSVALGQEHPVLFNALKEYYCVDPREWR